MNKKIILIFLILIITQSLVSAEYNYEDFIFHLNELNQEGTLTQELIDNLENLSPEQKLEIIKHLIRVTGMVSTGHSLEKTRK